VAPDFLPAAAVAEALGLSEAELIRQAAAAGEVVTRAGGNLSLRLAWFAWMWPELPLGPLVAALEERELAAAGFERVRLKGSGEDDWGRGGAVVGRETALRIARRLAEPPVHRRCGKLMHVDSWGEAFCFACKTALCGICGQETGSEVRSRCMMCLMNGRVNGKNTHGGL
jgi:hypothetical protein